MLPGAGREMAEAIAGLCLRNICRRHGEGKTVCALSAVKIPLENRCTKAAELGIFEKKPKNDLKVTAEGKNGARRGWLGKGRNPPTEEAEAREGLLNLLCGGEIQTVICRSSSHWLKTSFCFQNCCILLVRSEVDPHLWIMAHLPNIPDG